MNVLDSGSSFDIDALSDIPVSQQSLAEEEEPTPQSTAPSPPVSPPMDSVTPEASLAESADESGGEVNKPVARIRPLTREDVEITVIPPPAQSPTQSGPASINGASLSLIISCEKHYPVQRMF